VFSLYQYRTLVALICSLPLTAAAATYDFSGAIGGSSFPTCSGTWSSSGSTYTCAGSIALAAGDALLPPLPTTIIAQNGGTLAGNNTLGSGTAAVTLQTAWGALTLNGGNTAIYGNLSTDSGSISITGSNNVIYGSLTATNWGVITADNTTIYGSMNVFAAVTLTNVTVKGSISTQNTVSMVGGSVGGDIAATNGVTTNGTVITGDVRLSTSGSVSLTGGSVGGMVHSDCCTVATTNTNVGNGISSNVNTVTINGGTISGVISSGGGSGVKITNAVITSSGTVTVSANNVGIDIGSSTIYGSVSGNNSVNLHDGTTVWGDAIAGNWPGALAIDGTSQVSGSCSPLHARCGVIQMDHVLLSHNGSGITCLGSPVKVMLCNSADTSGTCVTSTKGVSGNIIAKNGATIVATVPFTVSAGAGSVTVPVSVGSAQTVTLEVSGLSLATAKPMTCWDTGSNTASCQHTFVDAGFIVSAAADNDVALAIPPQAAGVTSNYYLRAVKTNPITKACEAALTSPTTVSFGYECVNPTTCYTSDLMSVGGTTIHGYDTGNTLKSTSVTMNFDGNGNAPLALNYADAGSTTLHASKAVGAATLTGAWGFVTRPAGFALAATCTDVSPNVTNSATLSSDLNQAKFCPAGGKFNAAVSAVAANGNVTPNFGRESAPQTVTVNWSRHLPTGTGIVDGTLPSANPFNYTGNAINFTGTFGATGLTWSEVGVLKATMSIASGDYLGIGSTATSAADTSAYVGRFYPHHFVADIGTGLAGNCAVFAYSGRPGTVVTVTPGQPLNIAVRAMSMAQIGTPSSVTVNFTKDGFAKSASLSMPTGGNVGALYLDATRTLYFDTVTAKNTVLTIPADKFASGVWTISTTDASNKASYVFNAYPTIQTLVQLHAEDADTQGMTEGDRTLNIRSGRLRLSNNTGAEKQPLDLPLQAQFWSGMAWVINKDDGCTSLPQDAFYFLPGSVPTGVLTNVVTLENGAARVLLSKPSVVGTADIAIDLSASGADRSCLSSHGGTGANLPWLRTNGICSAGAYDRDPSARATFGIYTPENRRLIHVREMY
jgi:MSHA biogenesis protein MshQ